MKKSYNIILLFVALTVLNVAVCSLLYIQGSKHYKELIREKLETSSISLEMLLDPAQLYVLLNNPHTDGDEQYKKTIARLAEGHKKNPKIKYVYTVHKDQKGFIRFGLDTAPRQNLLDSNLSAHAFFNTTYDEAPEYIKQAFETRKPVISKEAYTDKWGTFTASFTPIFHNGQLISVLGVELDYGQYQHTLDQLWYFVILLFTGILSFTTVLCYFVYRAAQRLLKEKELSLEIENKEKIITSEARMAEVGRMMACINHEINNPLQIILGFSRMGQRLIDKDVDVKEFGKIFTKIETSVKRVTDIIVFMKELIKNEIKIDFKSQNFKEMINEVKMFTELKSREHSISINIDNIPDKEIICKKISIQQVLINLLVNSIEAIKDKNPAWINMSYREDDSYHYIRVDDSGQGISPEEIEKINKGYYTTKPNGSGLGLILCKKIAELHGGQLLYVGQNNTAFELSIKKDIKVQVNTIN